MYQLLFKVCADSISDFQKALINIFNISCLFFSLSLTAHIFMYFDFKKRRRLNFVLIIIHQAPFHFLIVALVIC